MKTQTLLLKITFLALIFCAAAITQAIPLGTAFTYQGRLHDAGSPANGLYDFKFSLYDANVAGSQVNSDVNVPDVNVTNGYLTVKLDFGTGVFDGNDRWLEIGVRAGNLKDPNSYTILSPRQELTPTPYAIYATTAGETISQPSALPSGVIVMWSGSTGSIPSGWALCNGANGTPDLRDRFIVGAGNNYSIGNIGGSSSHSHGAGSYAGPGHTHTANIGGSPQSIWIDDNSGGSDYWGSPSGHTHPITIDAAGAGSISGTSASANNLPPYYALAYIMKL